MVDEFHRSNDRRLGNAGQSRKDGKTEQKFERSLERQDIAPDRGLAARVRLSLAL